MNDLRNDVVVVGAGPAGLATAIGLAERGRSVRVIDRAEAPIDKACGEGLMPHGAAALERLGIDPTGSGGRRFSGIRYVDGEHRVEGRFSGRPGMAIRRTALQRVLLDRAVAAGAEIELGLVVRGLSRDGVTTDDGERRADWIVGADGLRSQVRRWSGLDRGWRGARFGIRRHYAAEPWSELVEVWWGDRCEAYITPVGRGEIGVAILWEGGKGDFDDHLARFPALAERLAGAVPSSSDSGAGPLERRAAAVARGRLALVGDASGYIDALTGEGLSVGFLQAEALAEAIARGDLGRYRSAHRRIGRWPALLTRSLLAIERRPALRRRVMRSLATAPGLFARLVQIHAAGERPGLLEIGRLLWRGREMAAG